MAKKSSIEKNNRRKRMTKNAAPRRAKLKAIIADRKKPMEERFAATLKLAEMPRNSSATRIRNRCEMTGRPRSNYRKNKLRRIPLRELGAKGLVPGLVKSSWEGGSHHVNARSHQRPDHPYPQRADALEVEGLDPRLEDARQRARGAEVRRLHPRLRHGGASLGPQRARDRAEIFRRRARDPRDRARLQARPAR